MHSQPKKPTVPWAAPKEAWPAGRGRTFSPPLSSGETPPAALRPTTESSAQKKHGPVGAGPEEGYEDD